MTVQSDLEKAVADAEAQMGIYAQFEAAVKEPEAKKMFNEMAQDMKRHVESLTTRLSYLEKNNPMYQRNQQKP
ncbi:MAG: rubrerythrin family protein [Bacteroidota bacterium]